MKSSFLNHLMNLYKEISLRNRFMISFGVIFILGFATSTVLLLTLISVMGDYQYFFVLEAKLSQYGDDIRYYDVVLTDSVHTYLIDPSNQAAYDRYYEAAAALDAVLAEARVLAVDANIEDLQFFEDIDRVNQRLVALEEAMLSNPSLDTALPILRGEYATLKAEYSGYVETFVEDQAEEYINGQQTILSHLRNALIALLVLSPLMVVLIIGFSFGLTRYVLARVSTLKNATIEFAGGNLNARAEVKSADELGGLAVSFNTMAATQQEQIRSLEIARREAEEATRMKDLFLATMSHELRTPLNAMIGFLHLMLYSGQLDDDNDHMAERSLANSQRLLTLINNILDLSRIATGGLEIVPGQVRLSYVASGLYNDLKVLVGDKDLRLELDVDPAIPETISHDEARISQIVTNLVSNAIKFTESGTVTMAFKRRDDRMLIQVTDTGIGIPQSKQHLIFDDFFQVDATSTRKQQGAGLGLAIVKRLVLLMNGKINLVSEPSKGSTFTVELPLNLPRYEPGDQRKRAENVFVNSVNEVNSLTQPAGSL